jgi:hypothetical protein
VTSFHFFFKSERHGKIPKTETPANSAHKGCDRPIKHAHKKVRFRFTRPDKAAAGESERALFAIDSEGVIRWSYVSPVGINPGADGIFRALKLLKARGVNDTPCLFVNVRRFDGPPKYDSLERAIEEADLSA